MQIMSSQFRAALLFALLLVLATSACTAQDGNKSARLQDKELGLNAETIDDGKVSIKLAGNEYRIAYADTHSERQLGLMYRRKMCDDCGMLFKFDNARIANIWMKNTYIPLDLAYITEQGEIVDIFQLTPHDLTSVPSSSSVLYALEMNQGWFAKKGIRVGDKVEMLP